MRNFIKLLFSVVTPLYFGGGGGAQQSTTTTQNFSPEEAAQRALVQQEATRIYQSSKDQIANSPYPGAAPVPLGPDSLQAQDMLRTWANGAGTTGAQTAQGYSDFLMTDAMKAESNPYLQSAIGAATRPIDQAYTDPGGVFSSIRTSSQQAGPSTRQGIAEGIAGRGYLNAVGDVSSKMAYQNYADSMKNATTALALGPQTAQLGQMPAMAIGAIGQQNEMIQQMQGDYASQQKMWELNAPWAPLQNYANIVFGGAAPGTTSTSTGGGSQSPNRAMGALGGAAQGAMLGSVVPGIGTAVGAGVGALLGLFGS